MNNAKNVINYYVLCNKLKHVIRTGWKEWHVKSERIESVAEHIYSVQMLAIAMYSEYKYDIDIKKVIMILAIHELEEILIGDLTIFEIKNEDKNKIGHEAIKKILNNLKNKNELESLILEFDEKKTKGAQFAFFCDKLDADLQCKLYDEKGCVDLNNQNGNKIINDPTVKSFLDKNLSWSEMWLKFSQGKYNYDKNFMEVSEYAFNNKICLDNEKKNV